jgi:hypothetical protein
MAEDPKPRPLDPLSSIGRAQELAKVLQEQDIFAPTPLTAGEILQRREMLSGLPGLEPTDYTGQLGEASQMAKLQLGLALAARGFGSMGGERPPRPGEMAISTVGRELLSPLAGDAMTVAQQMYDQKLKLKAAEKAQQAGLTQAALTLQQQESGREEAAEDRRFALAKELTERNFTATPADLQRTVNGKTTDFFGFTYADATTGLPKVVEVMADGKMKEVPTSELSFYRKPVAGVGPKDTKVRDRVIQVPIRDESNQITGWEEMTVRQAEQVVQTESGPDLEFGARLYPILSNNAWLVPGKDGFRNPVEGFDYVATDLTNWNKPSTEKLWIKGDLPSGEMALARAKLGKHLAPASGVNRSTFVNKSDPTRRKYFFDVKGRSVNITAEEADRWLTVTKPEDIFPEGGEQVGTKTHQLTVTDENGDQKVKNVVLWESEPGKLGWRDIATNSLLPAEEAASAWGTIDKDIEWQSLRPVMETAFSQAVELRRDLDPGDLEKLREEKLTQADLKTLAPLSNNPAAFRQKLDDIINNRVRLRTGVTPTTPASVPESVLQLDPRVKALTTVPERATSLTQPVVGPEIFQPWTRGNNLQLGTGSHSGFTSNIPVADVEVARKNWPAIKKAFNNAYGARKPLGDAEERVLLFSGLWKNLRGISRKKQERILSDESFRAAFDAAMGQYNAAAAKFKPAAEISIGKGGQQQNLQSGVEAELDSVRDNVIMLRFKDQGGAWFADGGWLAEFRGSGFGELFEAWTSPEGRTLEHTPTDKWLTLARPDSELNSEDLKLKHEVFEWFNENTTRTGDPIGLTEFERAAEYLGALDRYKIRAFSMIKDSRPSDKDIEILLAAFVNRRDSDSVVFAKLHELQNRHVTSLTRFIDKGLALNAVFAPEFLVNLDHTSRALRRSSIRDLDPRQGGRAKETARLFKSSSNQIINAVNSVSGRIIPGYRSGAISPLSGNVDEQATANLYRRVLSAAQEVYPDKTPEAAVAEFTRQGFHLTRFLGVYGEHDQSIPPAVREKDRSWTIPADLVN